VGGGALLLVTLSGCSLLVDSSKYTGGGGDGGVADAGEDAPPVPDAGGDAASSLCGNDGIDGEEQCDDGNRDNGDGCSADCTLEPAMGMGGCAAPVAIPLVPRGDDYVNRAIGITNSGTNAIDPRTCDNPVEPRPGALEQAFSVELPAEGHLTATVRPLAVWDPVLYIHFSCNPELDEIACADDSDVDVSEVIATDLPVGTYFIVVDGFEPGEMGPYELTVTFRPTAP
jgi:cysteine-rich repeat protein